MRSSQFILACLLVQGIHAQTLQNGDFHLGCDTCATKAAFWEVSWKGRGVTCQREEDRLRIACKDSADAVGFVEQAVRLDLEKGPVLFTLSAMVSTTDLRGKGTSLNIACYDSAGGFLTNKDLGVFASSWIHGTQEARPCSLKLMLPKGTATVKVGALVNGRGEAWFDDFQTGIETLAGRKAYHAAAVYVTAAMDTIRRHAIYRDSVDLECSRHMACLIAGEKAEAIDRHLAVEYLLQRLGDHHSFLMSPEAYAAWKNEGGESGTTIIYATHRIIEGYGYVSVPGFPSGDSLAIQLFADSLQGALAGMDGAGVKGWIVDLRQNTGGNMEPMVAGLGPLFDPGVLGCLTDVHGEAEHWWYRDGTYGWDDEPVLRIARPVTLARKGPIAVLTGQRTGSSGECTTISFIGNSRTRSFGQPTWGLTTGNGEFELPDGARMFMASTIMGDRHGRLFHGPIVPDEVVEEPADGKYDATLEAALKWLKVQR